MSVVPVVYAESYRFGENVLDNYARNGVALSRDAAHVVIAALRRDAAAMRARGGEPNEKCANENDELALNIGKAITRTRDKTYGA